ncbi:MAG TPA: carbohydrate ABC transporter permease, partial [Thermaerobacter sp.]
MALLVVAGVLLTSTLGGYALARYRFRLREAVFVLFLTSLMIPFQLRMIPLYAMTVKAGLLDTFTALVAPFAFDALGIFLMRQFFLTVPQEYVDCARIDGASEWRILWQVMVPQARPGLVALAILTFSHTWEEYLWPLIVSTSDRTRTLPLALQFFNEQYSTNIHYQMAAATLAVIPSLALFFLLQRQFVEGHTFTGIKG